MLEMRWGKKKTKTELPLTPRDTHLACLATPGPHRATTTVGTINARRVNAIRFKLAIEGKSNRCQKPRAASCIYSCIAFPPKVPPASMPGHSRRTSHRTERIVKSENTQGNAGVARRAGFVYRRKMRFPRF